VSPPAVIGRHQSGKPLIQALIVRVGKTVFAKILQVREGMDVYLKPVVDHIVRPHPPGVEGGVSLHSEILPRGHEQQMVVQHVRNGLHLDAQPLSSLPGGQRSEILLRR
jgi:hypothetical protein